MPQAASASLSLCIFCDGDSRLSVSWEHIVPEALENDSLVLSPGAVCNACNNYLGRKVEAPVVSSAAMVALRHLQGVGNKRGRIPNMPVRLANGMEAEMILDRSSARRLLEVDAPEVVTKGAFTGASRPTVGYAAAPDSLRTSREVARFVAKSGYEYIALENLHHVGSLVNFDGAPELDPCRRFVRYGQGPDTWEVSVRRIYEADTQFADDEPGDQRVSELDFLVLGDQHIIFAMSIFGLEMYVCLTGPSLAPYRHWLKATGSETLLYPKAV
ncbi:hypothetical protein H9L10_13160 [Phycicoccus endophyticus]|uniref:HNH endonuclease 5 domain-containing protein n=1 Tax=Phycicoccus endophyticus TaxID=1690220 RepID=A0A7G9R0P0_9MICO|nr:HNH endonuclease [Phycicoccus endophyticus]QNN49165.1 hypothetical protein H9L10_13160 [Phycicoccus endophyticus]GGL39237.1 hypothetical protein GCM10012283_22170 [Phycicoccus endophyticus]